MRISYRWLKEWTPLSARADKVANTLTNLGFAVDGISVTGVKLPSVITVKIESVEKHPNADRLSVAKVFDGKNTRTIVCGASNIAPGQIVPLALPGTTFPDGKTLSISSIRGVESQGMMCSEKELGLSDNHGGILILPPATPIGKNIKDLMGGEDVIFDLDVPPHRPDALSHIGLARELAAASHKKLKNFTFKWKENLKGEPCRIKIEAPKLCHRYLGKILTGVKVGPSPDWMVRRLTDCGIRSINNIVDITNFVLLEFGHPLHAFDLSALDGREIRVRLAKEGENILALDGKVYPLSPEDLVIADAMKPVAIAGIMGGEPTSVYTKTTEILLESAVFDRVAVRQTSRRLGLKSESSIRFEKGTDYKTAELASLRAAQLICELAGGKPGRSADPFPVKPKPKTITLSSQRLEEVIGQPIKAGFVTNTLNGLEFKPKIKKSRWTITVPPHRKDLHEEFDVIEEVVRHLGYDNIESKNLQIRIGNLPVHQLARNLTPLIDHLMGSGLTEIATSSLANPALVESLGVKGNTLVPLANPLSNEESILRPLLTPQLLKAIKRNTHYQKDSAAFFEMGHRFQMDPETRESKEDAALCIGLYGYQRAKSWHGKPEEISFFHIKGLLEELNKRFAMTLELRYGASQPFLHPAKSFRIFREGKDIGFGGLIHPHIAHTLDLKPHLALLEMNIDHFQAPLKVFSKYSEYPAVERDLAVVISKSTPWEDLQKVITQTAGGLLKTATPFDIFEGEGMAADKKSLAFRVILQSFDKTLSESDINSTIQNIVEKLKQTCGAELR